jgi:hypothetical protein
VHLLRSIALKSESHTPPNGFMKTFEIKSVHLSLVAYVPYPEHLYPLIKILRHINKQPVGLLLYSNSFCSGIQSANLERWFNTNGKEKHIKNSKTCPENNLSRRWWLGTYVNPKESTVLRRTQGKLCASLIKNMLEPWHRFHWRIITKDGDWNKGKKLQDKWK